MSRSAISPVLSGTDNCLDSRPKNQVVQVLRHRFTTPLLLKFLPSVQLYLAAGTGMWYRRRDSNPYARRRTPAPQAGLSADFSTPAFIMCWINRTRQGPYTGQKRRETLCRGRLTCLDGAADGIRTRTCLLGRQVPGHRAATASRKKRSRANGFYCAVGTAKAAPEGFHLYILLGFVW